MSLVLSYFVCWLFVLPLLGETHKVRMGKCPSVGAMPEFEMDKFLGKWYVIQVYSGINKCLTLTFETKADKEGAFKVTQAREFFLLNQLSIDHRNTYTAVINKVDSEDPGSMRIKWAGNFLGDASFRIVDTDYKNYALIFECQALWLFSRRSFAILSRNKTLDGEITSVLRSTVESFSEDANDLAVIDHKGCTSAEESFFDFDFGENTPFGVPGRRRDPFDLLTDDEMKDVSDADNMIRYLKAKYQREVEQEEKKDDQ